MPTFLSDPAPAFYMVLLAFALVTGMMALRNQDRSNGIRFGIAMGILLLVAVIDKAIESPREEAVRRVTLMAEAADAKNADQFVEHLADTIEYRGGSQPIGMKKDEVRTLPFWEMLRQHNVHVAVWNFSRDDVKQTDANTIEIGFNAKGEIAKGEATNGLFPIYMRATFKKQPNGQWKLTAFASFDLINHDAPLVIPNFPR
jgi:hypothetical protein